MIKKIVCGFMVLVGLSASVVGFFKFFQGVYDHWWEAIGGALLIFSAVGLWLNRDERSRWPAICALAWLLTGVAGVVSVIVAWLLYLDGFGDLLFEFIGGGLMVVAAVWIVIEEDWV